MSKNLKKLPGEAAMRADLSSKSSREASIGPSKEN